MIISKDRGNSTNWIIQHNSLGNNEYLEFDSGAAANSISIGGGSLPNPTSTLFYGSWLLGLNTNNANEIAYCFAPVKGYSAMGSYTGNGSNDGPFVFTGFRPRWILVKATSSVSYGNWVIHDTARSTYNVSNTGLYANLSNAEDSSYWFDILSNGFKIRSNAYDGTNGNGHTYIYAAFAEHPLKTARAR